MTKKILPIALACLAILFLSGCTADQTGKVTYLAFDSNGSSSDSNQVKASANDTTPNYLFSKLAAGSNISLAILNPGANEQVEITASGSFTDENKVAATATDTTPDFLFSKLAAGTGISLAVQNLGGNENVLITATGSGTDTNCSITGSCANIVYQDQNARLVNIDFNGVLSGGDFNQSILDHNDSFSCPAGQAIQEIGNNTTCIPVGGGGSGSGRTYTSGTPATIEVNNDANTISQNFDGNFWSRASPLFPVPDANLLDLSWTKLQNYPTGGGANQAVQTIGDTLGFIHVPNESQIDANALGVINSLDLNNSLSYAKTDTNCATNTYCDTRYVNVTGDTMTGDLFIFTTSGTAFRVLDNGGNNIFDVNSTNSLGTVRTPYLKPIFGGATVGVYDSKYQTVFANQIGLPTVKTGSGHFVNLSVDDLNASCDDLNDNCLTETDGNAIYLKLYGVGTQTLNSSVANGLDINFTMRPSITSKYGLGSAARRFSSSFINQITANPGTGMPAIYTPGNTAFACAVGTDSCLDYNGTARFIGITDSNVVHHFWGTTGSASGTTYRIPLLSAPILGSGTVMFENAEYDQNFGSTYGALYQPQKYRNSVWAHVDSISFYGTPNDGIFDQNRIGDINHVGDVNIMNDLDVDGNIFGQVQVTQVQIGTTCTAGCDAWDGLPLGSNWSCIGATSLAAAASTCTDITIVKNCMCRN